MPKAIIANIKITRIVLLASANTLLSFNFNMMHRNIIERANPTHEPLVWDINKHREAITNPKPPITFFHKDEPNKKKISEIGKMAM
jgi:hypothetical protein